MEQNKNDKAIIGGVLTIISGAFGLVGGALFIFASFLGKYGAQLREDLLPSEIELIFIFYSILGTGLLILAIFTVISGAFAVRRKLWGLALAGSITGMICFFPCGIPGIVFVCLVKKEFDYKVPVPPPPISPV